MIQIAISNNVVATNCPPAVLVAARKSLTLENPSYHKLARKLGHYGVIRDFKYYKLDKADPSKIVFPRGFASRFTAYLDKQNIPYEVTTDFITKRAKNGFKDWPEVLLRDYQVPIVEAVLKADIGVVAASTGSGKSTIICAVARALGQTTTIITPTSVIQGQIVAEFKKWFNYDVGVVGGGEKNIKDITVASWQSLSADTEICAELAAKTSVLAVDECHSGVSRERIKVLQKFKPSKLFGYSGSPRRSKEDGRTESIFFFFGPIIAKYETTQIESTIEVIMTRETIPADEYNIMEDAIVENDSRNCLIAGLTMGEVGEGKKVLILCKRREHCQKLMELLPKSDMIWYADSNNPDRNNILMAMRNGDREFSVIVGSYALLGCGSDVPSLECLIMAGSVRSDVLVQQGIGRVLRTFLNKESALIYDLVDSNPIYYSQFRSRLQFYRSQKWQINGLDTKKK